MNDVFLPKWSIIIRITQLFRIFVLGINISVLPFIS